VSQLNAWYYIVSTTQNQPSRRKNHSLSVGRKAAEGGFGVVIDRVMLKPGETRDLGDVRARETHPKTEP
jgi:hypothetical protein